MLNIGKYKPFRRNGTRKLKLTSYQQDVPIGTKRLNIPTSLSHRDILLVEAGKDRCDFRSVGTFREIPAEAVLSHWFLDVIVYIPDLPLTPFGDFKVGMGLWNYKMITILLESIIFFGGLYIDAKSTKAINAQGTWGLWIMTGFSFFPTPKTYSARLRKIIS